MPGKNIIKTGARKFLDSLGIYTQEIKRVEIQSDDYNNPGSWHIDKSAKWIGLHKAQVTFDVNSIMKSGDNYKDIILVIDISGSMSGDKLDKVISDSKELIDYVLADTNNRVAIITFDSTSTIVSELSNKKDELLQKLDAITVTGCTNYDVALKNVDTIMNGYVKESNRDIVALFLTDGYPNEDTPNQIGTYESLKEKYPYMTINGIQYEMGTNIINEIKQVTDSQWAASQSTLNNVLFDAALSPIAYENFVVIDYIDKKFQVNSNNDIKVTMGTVTLEEENGLQKITWNIGKNSYITGGNASMRVNLILKETYAETEGFFPTNNKETIESKLPNKAEKTVTSTNTPVLKKYFYNIIYDANTPTDCILSSIPTEKYFVYQNVIKKTDKLTCDGYLFKGWEIDSEDAKDITKVNDDIFQMPEHDVTIRATWTRQSIMKSMDGTVYEKPTLYRILEEAAKTGTYAKEYTGGHKDSFIEDGTQKIYHWYGSDDTTGTAILDKNNVIFAGHCWQMIRTTDTGGVKMIYNGEAENNQCLDTRGTHVGYIQDSYDNVQNMSTAYYYGTSYTYNSTSKSFTLTGTVTTGTIKTGQYTCMQANADATCTTLYYVDTLSSGTNYYVLPLNTNSHYSQFGTLQFNKRDRSLADVGYMYNTRYENSYLFTGSGYLFGNSFTYNSEEYTLKDTTSDDSFTSLSNHHYTCLNTSGKCKEISYIYYFYQFKDELRYVNIKDGKSVENIFNEMLYNDDVNTTNSTIKTGVELWYEKYLLEYSDYIEDTIFCNDRSQSNSGINGWYPNGGFALVTIQFFGSSDLSCPNEMDQFSILNKKAKLKYKVGLMSYMEMNLLGNDYARKTGQDYWSGSSQSFNLWASVVGIKDSGNSGTGFYVTALKGVRPAISLKPGTEYVDGDGSMANPYIVEID